MRDSRVLCLGAPDSRTAFAASSLVSLVSSCWGLVFGVRDSGFRVQGLEIRDERLGILVVSFGFWFLSSDLWLKNQGSEFRIVGGQSVQDERLRETRETTNLDKLKRVKTNHASIRITPSKAAECF